MRSKLMAQESLGRGACRDFFAARITTPAKTTGTADLRQVRRAACYDREACDMRSSARPTTVVFVVCAAAGCGLDIIGSACAPFGVGGAPLDGAIDAALDARDEPDGGPLDAGLDATPASCADLLARDAALHGQSRRYTIDPDGPGSRPALLVFCDMTVDDGGWTLVARSSVPSARFGWTAPSGDVSDVEQPYALDVVDAGLAFAEVMVADRKPYEFGPATHAYKFAVPPNFVAASRNAPLTTAVTTVLGDCTVAGGPATLRYAGYTGLTDHFFFGDNPGADTHTGLGADVFTTTSADCASGASLNGSQGLIFVR
jgi:hypothetical protein